MLRIAAFLFIVLFVIFTWQFWVGLLFIAGPVIPAAIIAFVVVLGVKILQAWLDERRAKV